MTTPGQLLDSAARVDASRPMVTSYDDTRLPPERVELSVATVLNWVVKIGNALSSEWGLESGDSVAIDLPSHWTGAVIALATWTLGAEIVDAGSPATGTVRSGPAALLSDRELILTMAPMGLDLSGLVASWPDQPEFPPLSGTSDVVSAADSLALPAGARLLSVLPFDRSAYAAASVVAPLSVGGSLILVREANPEPARLSAIATVEQATHTAGVDVDGLARIL